MEIKNFRTKFSIDDNDDDKGLFTGYASIWEVVDDYGDCVDRGAFKKTLKESKHLPICWSHNLYEPMGIIYGEEDDKGLKVEGHLNMDVQLAREKRSLMIQGAINGLSIQFRTIKDKIDDKEKVRHLKEVKLYEISPCVWQACPGAVIDEVKMLDPQTLRKISDLIRTLRADGLKDDSRTWLYEARLAINALLGTWEPDASTPGAGEPQDSDKSETLHLLENFRLVIERAGQNS